MSEEALQIKNCNLGAALPTSWINGGQQGGGFGIVFTTATAPCSRSCHRGFPRHRVQRASSWMASQGYNKTHFCEYAQRSESPWCFTDQGDHGVHGHILSSQHRDWEKHHRSLAPLHSCSSVWGWAQLQTEMGTGHVHGTVASPWERAVVPIRGRGGLKGPSALSSK